MKTFKAWTVHFVFSLRIFVSAHVIITSITTLGIFTKLCGLVLLLVLAGSLVPKFHFQLTKKRLEISPGNGWTQHKLAEGVTFSSVFCIMIEHALSTNDSAHDIRTLS